MNEPITLEQIDLMLDYESIKATIPEKKDPSDFVRTRKFTALGIDYEIEWWVNQSYLFMNDRNIVVPFRYMRRSNTRPHRSKMNLVFLQLTTDIGVIVRIENYPNEADNGS